MQSVIITDNNYTRELVEKIESTKSEILGSIFYWSRSARGVSGKVVEIANAINRASGRGVIVRLIFNRDREKGFIFESNKVIKEYLEKKGVSCVWGEKGRLIHAKYFIIDRNKAIIGSHNISTKSLTRSGEVSIITSDEVICKDLIKYFEKTWLNSRW